VVRPQHELAGVVRRFLPRMDSTKVPPHHLRALSAIRGCRTAALGGHVDACDGCGHVRVSYNSCRNRHCPKCQGVRKEMWLVQQGDMLLPVPYFHVVFTLPHEMNVLCMHGPRFMYGQLFRSAWHTLKTLALDKKWLGAKTAATMVLHTWSQTLVLHPHVHCIVPGGGLGKEGSWHFPKRGNGTFLFPVAAMKKLFRGHFMAQLKKAVADGTLPLPKGFPAGAAFKKWKGGLYQKDWVVFTKKPFSKVHNVVSYLGRYSHRVALTDHRITGIGESTVTFRYKDYRDGAKKKEMVLQGTEFLRRFCLHILPGGFRKVRTYGLLSNASKAKSLALARRSLGEKQRALLTRAERKEVALQRLFPDGRRTGTCPCCNKGRMVTVHVWACGRSPPAFLAATAKDN
jgi:hypothetical protein